MSTLTQTFHMAVCVCPIQVEVVEGVAGEEDHHDDQEEQGEENAEAEGQHDEHDEDGKTIWKNVFLKTLVNLNIEDHVTCMDSKYPMELWKFMQI